VCGRAGRSGGDTPEFIRMQRQRFPFFREGYKPMAEKEIGDQRARA
jgi:hypothetical protein